MANETDDVLEFLDSLPETKDKPKTGTQVPDKDIMEFLDELEHSNLDIKKKVPRNDIMKEDQSSSGEEEGRSEKTEEKVVENSKRNNDVTNVEETSRDDEGSTEVQLNDPISTLSNWWSSSGSATVSSFWSKTTEHASQLKDKIAAQEGNLNINDLGSKLTSIHGSEVISGLTSHLTKFVIGETDEVIRIHLVHDLQNVSNESIKYQVEDQFESVVSQQVQGGIRLFADEWDHSKDHSEQVNLNIFQGKAIEGEKLCMANLDNAVKTWEAARKELGRSSNPENKVSDVFLSILACEILGKEESSPSLIDASRPGNFHFIVILKDISNDVLLITRSQGFPVEWAKWLESSCLVNKEDGDGDEKLDRSDWVKPWISQGLNLTFGTVAQQYVLKRMNL